MDLMLTIPYLDQLASLGVTIPPEAANARGVFDEALLVANRKPSDDLKDALVAGKVTPANVGEMVYKAAAEHTAQESAHAIVRDLQLTLNRIMHDALRADEAQIVRQLREKFTPAAKAVTEAAKHFGPEATAEQIITGQPEVIEAWRFLEAHMRTLNAVSSAYRSLLGSVTRTLPDAQVILFVTGKGIDLDRAAGIYRANGAWLALARAGYTLRLNSTTEAATVTARAEDAKAQRAAAAREQYLKAHRLQHMPIGLA